MTKRIKAKDRKKHHEQKYDNIHRKTGKIEGEREEESNRSIQHVQSDHDHTSSNHHHHHHHNQDTHEKHHHKHHHHSGEHKYHDKRKEEITKQDERKLKKKESKHGEIQKKQQLISTAETFATSNNSPAVSQNQLQSESAENQVAFNINLNPQNILVSPEERKQNQLLGVEPTKYYQILGEQRVFHARPELISQRMKDIQQQQIGKVGKINSNSQNNPGSIVQEKEQQIQGSADIDTEKDLNSCSDLFSVDIQNRYFISGEKQQIVCKRCKSSGHFERMCVKDIKSRCFFCLGNHSAYACKQRVCFNCNNSGHFNKTCPFSKSSRCSRCQKLGHNKADCGAILINDSSSARNGNQPRNFRAIEEEWKKSDDWRIKCMHCGKQGHATCRNYDTEGISDDDVYGRDFQERMKKYRKQEEARVLKETRKEIISGARRSYKGEVLSEEDDDDIQIHVANQEKEKVMPRKTKISSKNNTKIDREYEKKKKQMSQNKKKKNESDGYTESEQDYVDSDDMSRSDYESDLFTGEDDSDSYDKYKEDNYRESSRQRSRSKNQIQHHNNHHHHNHHHHENNNVSSQKHQHKHHNHDTKNHHHHHSHNDHISHNHNHSRNSSKSKQNSKSHTQHNNHSNSNHDRYFTMEKEHHNMKNIHETPRSRRKSKQ